MSIESPLRLIVGPDKILETPCRPDFRIPEWVIPEMFELLRRHHGLGLAAPQVGIDARLFVTVWGMVYINPEITWHSDCCVRSSEGCLSFPGVVTSTLRYSEVEVCGLSYYGPHATVLQHEIDHLNGLHIAMKEAR